MSGVYQTDVLIIGAGIAGGVAALQLADAGVEVLLVTRSTDPLESNTLYAQGGIIYRGEDDSPELLAEDIQRAGAGLCNPAAVATLAEEGPALIESILMEKLAVPFDRTPDGRLSLVKEGSHSVARIIHRKDNTGKAIEEALIRRLQEHPNVTFLAGHTAVDLLTPAHHSLDRLSVYRPHSCAGAYLLNRENGKVVRCLAKNTILATGGLGQIYLRTSNPPGARGDGLAMAYRAGARAINAEYIQFHPTTFHHPLAPHFLISEAVRGAGARLINDRGEPFMERYAPKWKDLAPRDIVARSIHEEMLKRDIPHVFLDLCSYMKPDKIPEQFPTIYRTCLNYGVDVTREPIPVVPAAHYSCGGIWVDHWGQTTIHNLYAAGEVACTGVHGANRLASSSLLEGLVWGALSARHIERNLGHQSPPPAADYPPWQDEGLYNPDPALLNQDMTTIKNVMWNYVGLVRSTHRLKRALRELRNLEFEIEQFYRRSRLTDGLIGLRNAVRTAIIVTAAAWENKKSRGCHYRMDDADD